MHTIISIIILLITSVGLFAFSFYLLYTIPVKDFVDREQREEKLRIKTTTYPEDKITESEWYKHIATEVKQLCNN